MTGVKGPKPARGQPETSPGPFLFPRPITLVNHIRPVYCLGHTRVWKSGPQANPIQLINVRSKKNFKNLLIIKFKNLYFLVKENIKKSYNVIKNRKIRLIYKK